MTEFDWVSARFACTAESAFERMRKDVMTDVANRCQQQETLSDSLEYFSDAPHRFGIRKQGSHEIVFERIRETIQVTHYHVSGTRRSLVTVEVGMNEDGECTLKHGDRELQSWQVRRLALEDTFFGA